MERQINTAQKRIIRMQNYEEQMLEAWVGNNLSKQIWYKKTFAKYKVNRVENYALNWSWWGAFFGGFFITCQKGFYRISDYFRNYPNSNRSKWCLFCSWWNFCTISTFQKIQ